MSKYLILGKSGAGSLIPEFLFTELGIDYEIKFTNKKDIIKGGEKGYNPLGKIPVLILPNGTEIFESLAIVNYITMSSIMISEQIIACAKINAGSSRGVIRKV